MTVGTVSTYALFQSTLSNINTVESSLAQEQEQLSSGNENQTFSQMPGQTQNYLSFSDNIDRITQYLADHQVVETNVNAASSVLSQVITTATQLQDNIATRINGVSTQGFSSQLTATWQTLVGQINTNVGGLYVLSGTDNTTPPVSTTAFPTSTTPNTSYYQGNTQSISTRIDDNTVITTNVTAGDPGFQDIFAGLALAQQGDANNDTSDLQQAETLVQQGLSKLTALQATVGATASQLATSDTNLNSQKLYYQGLVQNIGNTDIVAVSTQVAQNQTILEAAFKAFSTISSLSLVNFLK